MPPPARLASPARPPAAWCRVAASCTLALWAALAAWAESPAIGAAQVHLERYRGKWTGDARFDERFGTLPQIVLDAQRQVHARLGISARDPETIHVYVVDVDLARYGMDRARSWSRTQGATPAHLVALFAEYYLSGDSDLGMTVVHEMTHAVMRERMGQAAYERLPYWVREGLAVHVAQEGEHHLRRNLQVAEDVDALLTGLMTETRSLIMYPYAWLAIDLIERQGGPGSVATFARALVRGVPVESAIGELTGWDFAHFETALRAHVLEQVRAQADGLDALRAAKQLYARRQYHEAREAFDAFLAAHPDSCFAATARYYRARSFYIAGRHAEARTAFELCLERDLGRSGLSDEAQLYLGICHYVLGDSQDALLHLRRFVNLHPHSNEVDLGLLYLGRALARLGQRREALDALEAVPQARGARERYKRTALREAASLRDD